MLWVGSGGGDDQDDGVTWVARIATHVLISVVFLVRDSSVLD